MPQQPHAAPPATHELARETTSATATAPASDAGDATPEPVAALANDLEYTLTIGQARALFASYHRKVPAERTLQNYCAEGTIAGQKIRTSTGAEWLINEASLLDYIEQQPIIAPTGEAPPAPHDLAREPSSATATTAASDAGDATAEPVGERRRLADVLIDNARLFAEVEGRDQVIAELKEDRNFLREEVREARKTRDDVKSIANRMLETLESMALGGKLLRAEAKPEQPVQVAHQDITEQSASVTQQNSSMGTSAQPDN